jgi:hypothetical protein
MEWGVGASQQKTKGIPPNICYNRPNQSLEFKFILVELVVLSVFLKLPIIKIAHDKNEALKNTNVQKNYLGPKGSTRLGINP